MDTVLDGDDTDLLILLCYHAELDMLDLFFPTRIKSKFQASILEYKTSEEKAWPRDLSSHSFYPCYQTEWMRSDLWIVWNLQRSSTKEVCQRYPLSWTRQGVWQSSSVLVFTMGSLKKDLLDVQRFRRFSEKVSTGTSQIQPQSCCCIIRQY